MPSDRSVVFLFMAVLLIGWTINAITNRPVKQLNKEYINVNRQ